MKALVLCLGSCAAGVVLMALGFLWSATGVAEAASWSEEQAIKFNEASAKFHQVAHAHADQKMHASGQDHTHQVHLASSQATSISDAELAAAKAAWQEQMNQRDAAINRISFWKRLFRWSGASLILLGGVGYLIVKNMSEEE